MAPLIGSKTLFTQIQPSPSDVPASHVRAQLLATSPEYHERRNYTDRT